MNKKDTSISSLCQRIEAIGIKVISAKSGIKYSTLLNKMRGINPFKIEEINTLRIIVEAQEIANKQAEMAYNKYIKSVRVK